MRLARDVHLDKAVRSAGSQTDYYDHHVDPEFEINRPHGESRLYKYLMDFKFTRVVSLLRRPLAGSTVLVICCGSGMDAEYLFRVGARVTALDISAGCLHRARARATRYGIDYGLVRADAVALPFPDKSFDYAFVHDGLHHLDDPAVAIAEMARVARRGIMVSEPASALLTRIPTKVGLLSAREEAGNIVNRLDPAKLASLCSTLGFDRVVKARYLVKYGHPPASWWRDFDSDLLFNLARLSFVAFGIGAFGHWGNKLALVAELDPNRPDGHSG